MNEAPKLLLELQRRLMAEADTGVYTDRLTPGERALFYFAVGAAYCDAQRETHSPRRG